MSELANTQRNRELVMDAICHVYEITEEQLCSRRRLREITSARQMYYKVAREHLGMTYTSIGSSLRNEHRPYDHTTVMHSVALVNGLISVKDADIIHQYEKVGADQLHKLLSFLQREDITFTILESVILQQTKNETNGTEQAGDD
jgi:chromosomal replication initiation ATPase DnaA